MKKIKILIITINKLKYLFIYINNQEKRIYYLLLILSLFIIFPTNSLQKELLK